MQTLELKTPDGKRSVVLVVNQIYAITETATGATAVIGPQNAVVFVEGTVKEVEGALKRLTKEEAKNGI